MSEWDYRIFKRAEKLALAEFHLNILAPVVFSTIRTFND